MKRSAVLSPPDHGQLATAIIGWAYWTGCAYASNSTTPCRKTRDS